jgi:Arc/MetJ-type ribon-helix-helix transcriptional regulator
MNMHLKKSHQEWLDAQIVAGRFASIDEAMAAAIARLQAYDAIDDAWAKPLIDEALEALDRGEGTPWRKGETLEKIKARRAADQ